MGRGDCAVNIFELMPVVTHAPKPSAAAGRGSTPGRCFGRESTSHHNVVHQAVPHGPDHEFLFRLDSKLVL